MAEQPKLNPEAQAVFDNIHATVRICRWFYECGLTYTAEFWKCTIDRIDVNGNYCPENCRWVGMDVQQRNKRNSKKMDRGAEK